MHAEERHQEQWKGLAVIKAEGWNNRWAVKAGFHSAFISIQSML